MYKISNYTYSKVCTLLKTGNFKKSSLANTLRKVAAIISPGLVSTIVKSTRQIPIGNVKDVIGAFKDVSSKGGKALLDRDNRRMILDVFSSMRNIKTPQQVKKLALDYNNEIDFSDVIKRLEKAYVNSPRSTSFSQARRIFEDGITQQLSPRNRITPFYSRLDDIIGDGQQPLGLIYNVKDKGYLPHLYINDYIVRNPYSVSSQYSRAILKGQLDAALGRGEFLPRHSAINKPIRSYYYAYTGGDKNKEAILRRNIAGYHKNNDYNEFYKQFEPNVARFSDHSNPEFITYPGLNIATYNNPNYHYDIVAAMNNLNNNYLKNMNKNPVVLDNLADISNNSQKISMARAIHQPYIRLPKEFR